MKKHRLLELECLPEPGSVTLDVDHEHASFNIIVIRHEGGVYGYLNRCPHLGTPLDWLPGEVLDDEQEHIICATHGAIFRIQDGICITGPCAGRQLSRIPLIAENGQIYLGIQN